MPELANTKREVFAQEYLVDLNAKQSAIRAGYSEKTAHSQGQRLLKDVEVEARIQELKDERAERTNVTAEKVITELAKLGFSTMREVASWDADGVRLKASDALTDEAAACVKDIHSTREIRRDKNGDETEIVNTKIQLHDKRGSLKLLGDHLGVFDSTGGDIGKLADTFLAGVQTVKDMEAEDLSESR